MIDQVRIQNLKAHRDTQIDLGRFTVLVGPNGSGKTSVLQALHAMGFLARKDKDPYDVLPGSSPYSVVNRASPAGPIAIEVRGHTDETAWIVSMGITLHSNDRGEERWEDEYAWRCGDEQFTSDPARNKRFYVTAPARLRTSLAGTELYHFDAGQIAAPAYSELAQPYVARTGAFTAVVLAALKLEQEEAFERIQEELRRVVPNVERIRVRRALATRTQWASKHTPNADLMGHEVYLDFKGAANVPAQAASEGTLVTLALLTVLHSPTRPRLLLLDDLDQSLHPHAQIQLVKELQRLLAERPDLQIVASTHSPYILDEIEPKDVLVFALRDDSSVAHKRLSEHPEAARGVLMSGQIWSLDPEKSWVVEEKA
jgi:predicted ATPase